MKKLKIMSTGLSNCCKAEVTVINEDEGTSYYLCNDCNKPCDLWQGKEVKKKVVKKVVNMTQKIDWEKDAYFQQFKAMLPEVYVNLRKHICTLLLSSQSAHDEEIKKQMEKAVRLYLQDAWNDQSNIQALSPEGKTIIWGGIIGKQITAEWKKVKKHFDAISLIRGKV
jgi:hypothetical protein